MWCALFIPAPGRLVRPGRKNGPVTASALAYQFDPPAGGAGRGLVSEALLALADQSDSPAGRAGRGLYQSYVRRSADLLFLNLVRMGARCARPQPPSHP